MAKQFKGIINLDSTPDWSHIETDRAEVNDVGDEFPEKKLEMIATWFAVAGANQVFPLDDRTAMEQLTVERPEPSPPRNTYTYYPNTSEVPEGVAPSIRNRSFNLLANVTVKDPKSAQGVILTMGGRAGGHSMFLKGGKLYYVYNFLGMEDQKIISDQALPAGDLVLGVAFSKEKEEPKGVANGTVKLYCNDKVIGQGKIRLQPGKFSLSGGGLLIGRMGPDSVTKEYKAPFLWSGAELKSVTFNVSGEHYRDLETEALAMLSRE